MKRIWRTLIAALAICLMMAVASAETSDFTFSLNSEGTAYIVTGYTGSDAKVTVPDWYEGLPVVQIGSGAVQGNATITTAVLPSSIVKIGDAAFKGCAKLSKINTYTAAAEPPVEKLLGDVNLDGIVDAKDALLVLQSEAGWTVSMDEENADMDGSGKIDLTDATLILQAAGQE